jgi:hypothetical protein
MKHWTDSPAYDPANPFGVDLDGGRALDHAHRTFTRWLGTSYDLQALDIILATAAVQHLDGDPVWTILISGAGNAKTETVAPLAGAGAYVESAIASEGALLSGTAKKEQAKDATGGLLRKIGDHGTLVLKDFTTILSMNRDTRAAVLAALREIYDGRWTRNIGVDGGRTLAWEGRLTLIGAATTAYDQHHGVIAAMGDRFALVRTDSSRDRLASGRQALANVGHETAMRYDLSQVAGQVLAQVNTDVVLPDWMWDPLLHAADLVTRARTAVEHDNRGEVIDVGQPEAPTRFAKMLAQVARGLLAIGGTELEAINAALRVAHDSIPPLRLAALRYVQSDPGTTYTRVAQHLQKPKATVRRKVDELTALGLLVHDSEPRLDRNGQEVGTTWHHEVAAGVDVAVVDQINAEAVTAGEAGSTPPDPVPEKSVHAHMDTKKGLELLHTPTDISGPSQGCLRYACLNSALSGAKFCSDHIPRDESESSA